MERVFHDWRKYAYKENLVLVLESFLAIRYTDQSVCQSVKQVSAAADGPARRASS